MRYRVLLACSLVGGSLSGCCIGGLSSADCDIVIDKILLCDPSAAGTPRAMLASQCLYTSPRCVALDTSTLAGCTEFMGCLYDE